MKTGAWTRVRRFAPSLLVLAGLVAVFASGLADHLSLGELQDRRGQLAGLVDSHRWLTLGGYIGLYIAVVALSIPAALVMTLAGGVLFGVWIGGAAAAVSCTLGAGVIFLICRAAAGDLLQRRAGPLAARIEAGVRRDAFSYVLMLRLAPVAPFWLVNLALGLVDIPFWTFLTASFVGIAPTSLVIAGVGASLNTVFVAGGRVRPDVMEKPAVFLPLFGLALLSVLPIAVRRRRRTDKI